jgi:hypothetical protein
MPKKPFGIRLSAYDLVFRLHIREAEGKAKKSFDSQKWMMFGYWKAVAIHLRKVYREVRRDFISQELGFLLPIQRPAFYQSEQELHEIRAQLELNKKRLGDLENDNASLRFDLNRSKKALANAEERLAIRSMEAHS